MKPYRIQWQNTVLASKPWLDFVPVVKCMAMDEDRAVGAAHNKLNNQVAAAKYPLRALAISWEEFEH